jgi:hypothetical protein
MYDRSHLPFSVMVSEISWSPTTDRSLYIHLSGESDLLCTLFTQLGYKCKCATQEKPHFNIVINQNAHCFAEGYTLTWRQQLCVAGKRAPVDPDSSGLCQYEWEPAKADIARLSSRSR